MRAGPCTRAPADTMTGPADTSRTTPGSTSASWASETGPDPITWTPAGTRVSSKRAPSLRILSPLDAISPQIVCSTSPARGASGHAGSPSPASSSAGARTPSGTSAPTTVDCAVSSAAPSLTVGAATPTPSSGHESAVQVQALARPVRRHLQGGAAGRVRLFESEQIVARQVAAARDAHYAFDPCPQRLGSEQHLAGRAGQAEGLPAPRDAVVVQEQAQAPGAQESEPGAQVRRGGSSSTTLRGSSSR